jgi:hypothetical protein
VAVTNSAWRPDSSSAFYYVTHLYPSWSYDILDDEG